MKELVKNYKISFRWWRGDKKAIRPSHQELLEEDAWKRITEMMNEGCTSGELIASMDDIEYSGHWSLSEEHYT